jgi:hypothetical protein
MLNKTPKAYIQNTILEKSALRIFICLILEIYPQICIQYGLPSVDLYTSYGFLHTNARTFVYKQGILLHPRSRAAHLLQAPGEQIQQGLVPIVYQLVSACLLDAIVLPVNPLAVNHSHET